MDLVKFPGGNAFSVRSNCQVPFRSITVLCVRAGGARQINIRDRSFFMLPVKIRIFPVF
jgi:hypothetical protein